MKRAIVIGAGAGGLAIAIRLARCGWNVDVFEKSEKPGGKVSELRGNGFRFDAGPSLFTLPGLVNELLDDDLQFGIVKLPVITRYFWPDGMMLDAHADPDEFCREAERRTGVAAQKLQEYLTEAGRLYDAIAPVFIFNSLHRLRQVSGREFMRALRYLNRLRAFSSLHRYNVASTGDDRLVQLLDRYATYNGSDPYQTPATLRVIAHLEHNLGAFLPEGGIYSIVKALMKQGERLNVTYHFNQPVSRVTTEKGSVTGVRVGGKAIPAELVVSNSDIHRFYEHLLPDPKKIKRIENQQMSSSALIFYWGIRGSFPELEVHNILFSRDYPGEFKSLFRKHEIHNDPTIYIYISSKVFPDDAPVGCENWFVMVNAPENKGQNWQEIIGNTRVRIMEKINRQLGISLEDRILFEECLDPVTIEERTGSWHGSLYGPSSNSLVSAFRRHSNYSGTVRGLYFTGGSVHPGGGIPLCLSSARIVASLVEHDFKKQ